MTKEEEWEARRYQCSCGSGQESWWEHDAQNIPLCKVCDACRQDRLAGYRPCILSGYAQADVDEPIEPEESVY
jgi:hypothetical protein